MGHGTWQGGDGWLMSTQAPRKAEAGQTQNIPNFHDIHFTNLTVTRSPLAGRIIGIPEQQARDITFTNCKFQSTLGFMAQDAQDIIFDNVTITNSRGEALTLDNASVKWNGTEKSGTIGGQAERFY